MADTSKDKAELKKQIEALKLADTNTDFDKELFNNVMLERFFIIPSFEIYGGIAGLYDLGPPSTAIKANILNYWRTHFAITEHMLEVDCTSVTPEPVLEASGHTAKFVDLMVKDVVSGNCFRADHLLKHKLEELLAKPNLDPKLKDEYEDVLAQVDTYSKHELGSLMKKYGCKAPDTNNDLTDPEPFNLMFATNIGPTGKTPGFLRPETAQGIFVNFKRLLNYNGGKLPFAAAQIGQAFRNEIAPRSGLLRVREFTLAEIEHFVNPEDKSHPKFHLVKDTVLTLFPRDDQLKTKKTVKITAGEAVERQIIANETLAYFIVRTHFFMLGIGIKEDKLRFRQHLADEMAHYACDCWDAEILTSYGWVECVGHADRSAYDLTQHMNKTGKPLSAFIQYDEPRLEDTIDVVIDKGSVGKTFKQKAQILIKYLETIKPDDALTLEASLQKGSAKVTIGNDSFDITPAMVTFKKYQKRVTGKHIIPGVIEPSFGIGRILYAVLEHAFYVRKGSEKRAVLSLPASIAPIKASILPLVSNQKMLELVPKLTQMLTDAGIAVKVDDQAVSIGRRYARTDEIGIPFGITIDRVTLDDGTVTLRERDSTAQVRIKGEELVSVLQALIRNSITWKDVTAKYPAATVQEDEEDNNNNKQ
jgi:glycyl-tRNA synthetase